MDKLPVHPDYLFEVSWEVCNKVGGIYTTVSTKANTLVKKFGDNFIAVGPDIWREHGVNPDFTEDPTLFEAWRRKAASEGLKVKTGRWNINSKPVAILIDFSPFITHKDEIFAELYKDFGLDSLTGKWDYIEPALFGYAVGKVIKSFCDYYISEHQHVVAQLHEWLTGSAVLYLNKYVPAVATTFTTHATVVGRAIAGTGQPFYSKLATYNGDIKAAEFDVKAKHSLEKTAAQYADCFTTVSEITATECKQFLHKEPDVITPNGFEDVFVPAPKEFESKRIVARNKLLSVAAAACNQQFDDSALLIATGGRYEFKNKGMDVLLNALAKVNHAASVKKDIIAFFLVPAGHTGARQEIRNRLNNVPENNTNVFLSTHYLQNEKDDPILKRCAELHFQNVADARVKIIFVPVYLDGNDGVFDLTYYDLLIGFDLTAFPSYYEPWGYTPLESLAFHIPTVSTTLAGFCPWVKSHTTDYSNGLYIITRTDDNESEVEDKLAEIILLFVQKDKTAMDLARMAALRISNVALWDNLVENFYSAWALALSKLKDREALITQAMRLKETQFEILVEFPEANSPRWGRIFIPPVIPHEFVPLEIISKNCWWSWNHDAEELFRDMDPELWETVEHNPIALLNACSSKRFAELAQDKQYMQRVDLVAKKFDAYMSRKPDETTLRIAYFCMEYGLHSSIKLYSGGLGILAGDYLKESSDTLSNVVGVGLLYRFGYFKQRVSLHGEQFSEREENKFSLMPITPVRNENGEWKKVEVYLPGRTLYAKIWRLDVGRVPLYLLDTDMPENSDADRLITDQLYGGDNEHRLLQELLLGIGGVRMLDAVNAKPDIFHLNEGHAAFAGLTRIRKYVEEEHLTFPEAIEVIRASSLFTTHTPIGAGHDAFSEELLRSYLSHYPGILNFPWEQIMDLGKENIRDRNEKFSMTNLAIRLSQEVNGVSRLHEGVTKKMFSPLWKGYGPDELYISHVTNGVHLPTWTAPEWQELYYKIFGDGIPDAAKMQEQISNIGDISREKMYALKRESKKRLIAYLSRRLNKSLEAGLEHPQTVFNAREFLRDDVLIIGFARRFINYKRANLIFSDPRKLSALLNNKERPAMLLISGKAHPNDIEGQEMLKRTIETFEWSDLASKVIFLTNYDMDVARVMIQGVDVWLNTPVRLLEACGTSGMKAALNGTLNFSVLDGWWEEAYQPGTGWSLSAKQSYTNRTDQDELDAETIYSMLEDEIIPLYYNRNEYGVPEQWMRRVQKSIATFAMHFTATRMVDEYHAKYYTKLYERSKALTADAYALAKQIANWKTDIAESWASIDIKEVQTYDFEHHELPYGTKFQTRILLDPGKLSLDDLGIELVFARRNLEGELEIKYIRELESRKHNGRDFEFLCDFIPDLAGAYQYGFRLYPKNILLPHRQDYGLVKWI